MQGCESAMTFVRLQYRFSVRACAVQNLASIKVSVVNSERAHAGFGA